MVRWKRIQQEYRLPFGPKVTFTRISDKIALMFDISNARFAFLDLETTGLSPWFGDRICEVGIVISEGKRIKQQYQQLVNPERPLSPGAASTNGLSDDDLKSAPLFEEVGPKVLGLLSDTVVVCHNAQFDIQFLDSEYKRLGHEVQIPNLIDTLKLAREFYDLSSNSLGATSSNSGADFNSSSDNPLVEAAPGESGRSGFTSC